MLVQEFFLDTEKENITKNLASRERKNLKQLEEKKENSNYII